MTPKYWLLLGAVAVGTTQAVACSSASDSCSDTRTCVTAAGSGGHGEAGAPSEGGEAGQPVRGHAGMANGGAAGAPERSSAGQGGDVGDVGDAGMGGEAGMGGSAGAAPQTPTLFGACNVPGKTVCSAAAGSDRLSCDGSKWQPGSVCPDGELCDSASGACAKVIPECASVKPGASVCRGDTALKCGPDLVTTDAGTPCDGLCVAGACQLPICGDGKLEAGETCDDHNSVPGDGCSATCHVEVASISVGGSTSCAVSVTGAVKCWGDNQFGQLGQGNTTPVGGSPKDIANLKPIDLGTGRSAKSVVVGTNDVCALLDNKTVKCWGANASGQLGQGDLRDRGAKPGEMGDNLPPIVLGADAVAVNIGGSHACAILSDGGLKCWGDGAHGQLGYDNTVSESSPALVPRVNLGPGRTAKAVSCGYDHTTCAVLDDSTAKCWGWNTFGMLSLPDSITQGLPGTDVGKAPGDMASLPVLNLGNTAKSIGITVHSTCAVLSDDTARCWGANSYGQLGTGSPGYFGAKPDLLAAIPPIALGGANTVKSLSVGDFHTCAVLSNGSVKCWGNNSSGELGIGNTTDVGRGVTVNMMLVSDMPSVTPVPLGSGRVARQVSLGASHACALLDDLNVECWGANDLGQLGTGDHVQRGNMLNFTLQAVELGF